MSVTTEPPRSNDLAEVPLVVPSTPSTPNQPPKNGLESAMSNLAIKSESDAPPTAINMDMTPSVVPKALPTHIPGDATVYTGGSPMHVGGNLPTGVTPSLTGPPAGLMMDRYNSPTATVPSGSALPGASPQYTTPMKSTYPTMNASVTMTTNPATQSGSTSTPMDTTGLKPVNTVPHVAVGTTPFVTSSPLPMAAPPTISLPSIPPTINLATLSSSNPGAQ